MALLHEGGTVDVARLDEGGRFDMAPLDEVEGWTWLLMNYHSSTVINVHG